MEYNLLATTEKMTMSGACSQLWMNLRALGDPEPKVNKTRIKGIIWGATTLDPVEAIRGLRKNMKEEPARYDKLFRILPVLNWVNTSLENIVAEVENQKTRVAEDDTFRVTLEKRRTELRSMEVIGPVAELFDNTVDLENPDWVVLIEIMGKMTGVSIVPADSIFKVQVERAALIFSS
jgi:tRNA acetyltransferase TAN1